MDRRVAAASVAIAAAVAVLGASMMLLRAKKTKERALKRHRAWVCDFFKQRDSDGFYSKLMSQLSDGDPKKFKNFLRMSRDDFDHLLELVSPLISKQNVVRESIPAAQRLAITLRFLATGESFRSLAYLFRIPQTTISSILPECCDAIYTVLAPTYMKVSPKHT